MPTKVASMVIIPRQVVDQIKGVMSESPPKMKDKFLLKEAIAEMLPEIEAMLKKGYSYDELAALFSENSMEVKGATLKKYCSELRRAATAKGVKGKPKKELSQEPSQPPLESSGAVTVQETEKVQASVERQMESALGTGLGTTQSAKKKPVKQHSSQGNGADGFVDMPDDL
jgi:hypothetical protein